MFFSKATKFFTISSVIILSACTSSASLVHRVNDIDLPTFEKTKAIAINTQNIQILNSYAQNKYNGEYGENFAALPYEVFEKYVEKRFKAKGEGPPLYLVIEKASLIHNRNIGSFGYGGSNNDDVYTLDFRVRVISGPTFDSSGNVTNVKHIKTLRQRNDILTRQQKQDGQIDYLTRTIAEFDKKLIRALEENSAVDLEL